MSAVSCGHQSVSEYLIELGADVKVANSGGQTALHYAVSLTPLFSQDDGCLEQPDLGW